MATERQRRAKKRLHANIRRKHHCSPSVWSRAKKRRATFFGDHLWLVQGGEGQHVVYYDAHQFVCSCPGQVNAYMKHCSHIVAVENRFRRVIAELDT